MKELAIYILVSIIYQIISVVDEYFAYKKKMIEKPELKASINSMKEWAVKFWKMFTDKKTASGRRMRWIVGYAAVVCIPLLLALCPLLFPLSIMSIFYNIIFFRRIQRKKQEDLDVQKKHEEWMTTEGDQEATIKTEAPIFEFREETTALDGKGTTAERIYCNHLFYFVEKKDDGVSVYKCNRCGLIDNGPIK